MKAGGQGILAALDKGEVDGEDVIGAVLTLAENVCPFFFSVLLQCFLLCSDEHCTDVFSFSFFFFFLSQRLRERWTVRAARSILSFSTPSPLDSERPPKTKRLGWQERRFGQRRCRWRNRPCSSTLEVTLSSFYEEGKKRRLGS